MALRVSFAVEQVIADLAGMGGVVGWVGVGLEYGLCLGSGLWPVGDLRHESRVGDGCSGPDAVPDTV